MLAGGGVFGDLLGDFVYADGDAYPYNFLVASDAGDYLYLGNSREVLHLQEGVDGHIHTSAIYNNVGANYVDFSLVQEVSFDVLQDDFGSSSDDRYLYNAERDLLVVIKSRGDKHRFYVVDFVQGYPLITLDTILSAYQPSGFISLEGSKLVFDYTFDAHYYQDFSTQGHPTLASYPLMDYERLVEETRGMVEGVVEEALEQVEE